MSSSRIAHPISLYRYLLERILWCVVPIVLAGMAMHWYFERGLLQRQFDEGLVEKAMTLATLVTQHGEKLELEFADEFMSQYSRAERPHYFQIRYPDGTSLERSYSLHGEDLPFRHGPLSSPVAFETSLAAGTKVRCVGIEFPPRLGPQESTSLPVIIVVGAQPLQLQEALRRGYAEVAITGIVSLAGIAMVVWLALRKGVQLLERIVTEVEQIGPSSLDQPIDVDRAPEEIQPIVTSLNTSLQTIRGFVERERRFTADVAHELRTPIAELRAAADVALRWPDEESRQRLAVDARAIALQMGSLVESLLELARLESSATHGQTERVDLPQLLANIVDHARRSDAEGREIVLDAPAELVVKSHPQLWEVAARNLLDNAVRYSPPGTRIDVRLRADGEGAHLRVSNTTVSLDAASVARCTERFWRGLRDPQESEHFGLGLSIVQAACAKLGHRFDVELCEGVFHATIRASASELNG